MITGGTGSFGNAVLNRFLQTDIGEIRVFSRDEKKQDDMRKKYREPNIISIDANYDDKDTNVSNINITNPMQLEDYHPRPLEHTLTMELNDLIKK